MGFVTKLKTLSIQGETTMKVKNLTNRKSEPLKMLKIIDVNIYGLASQFFLPRAGVPINQSRRAQSCNLQAGFPGKEDKSFVYFYVLLHCQERKLIPSTASEAIPI